MLDDCVRLTPENLKTISSPRGAYVLLSEGKDLYCGIRLSPAIRKRCMWLVLLVRSHALASERLCPMKISKSIVSWPLKWPKRARCKTPATAQAEPRGGCNGRPHVLTPDLIGSGDEPEQELQVFKISFSQGRNSAADPGVPPPSARGRRCP